jgi:hypothetical protein
MAQADEVGMAMPDSADEPGADSPAGTIDAREPVERLLRDLRSSRPGLSGREAVRRLVVYGPNQLRRRGGRHVWRELGRQFSHPLALLLWAAAGLAWLAGIVAVAVAIVIVIFLNALFAFLQEMQAERAVEALQAYLPQHAAVLRDGTAVTVEAVQLVPGDVLLLEEGDRIAPPGVGPDTRPAEEAAAWCLQNGMPEDALQYSMAAGDAGAAADLVERLSLPAWWQGRVTRPRLTAGPLSMPRVCAWVMCSGLG